jgi:hypothetical protein
VGKILSGLGDLQGNRLKRDVPSSLQRDSGVRPGIQDAR